ncbi:hypothetical protein WG66_003040 [Moniliophthora roreri]|nr:hypothetical protein WG66_003040 [Moniliophthora roreri]
MAKLELLPTELILEVIEYASYCPLPSNASLTDCHLHFASQKRHRTDILKTLRLVNRRFHSITTSMLFSSVVIKTREMMSIHDLSSISSSLLDLSGHIQRLNLQCLDRSISYKAIGARHRGTIHRISRRVFHCSCCEEGMEKQRVWSKHLRSATTLFTSLTSLSVSGVSYSVSLSTLWKTLTQQKIHIKDITVQWRIEPELLDYLASFSGIKHLAILCAFPDGPRSSWDGQDRRLAIQFANRVLPKHAESLETLNVSGHDEGCWAFRRTNAAQYGKCTMLRELGISINSEDIGSNSINSHRDVMKPCLELAHNLQYLESLIIYVSRNPHYRRIEEHGIYHDQHEKYTTSLIREAIRNVVIPNPDSRSLHTNYHHDSEEMSRVILVTGSNTGIGLALVKLLASKPEKHTVYLAARNEKAGNDALKALHDEGISNVKFAQLDVTSKSSIQSAVETISKAEGKLDVLVHNAGLARLDAPQNASSVDTDVIKDTMEVNFYGVIHTTQAFLPLLRKSAKPVILLVSTDMASNTRQSRPDSYLHVVAYNTSKAAANSYLIGAMTISRHFA